MSKGAFGEHLRREREMRGVSLEEISAATRIGTRFLEALESEQWERLPGGVFNRGFVRATARFLGLDEENLLAEFALATNAHAPAAVPPQDAGAQSSGGRRLGWLLLAAVIVLAAAGWFAWHRYAAARAARKAAHPAGAAYQSFGTSPASAARPATSSGSPAGNPTNRGTASDPASPLELKIEAGKSTTLQVIADGKRVFNGRIGAGKNQRFRAQEQFEVSAANASAVLLELNGQTLAPLGPPGQPGKATLTRKDLRKTPGGPD